MRHHILAAAICLVAAIGCQSPFTKNNTNLPPGGSTFNSIYSLDLKDGKVHVETPKDTRIQSLTATFNTNGTASITINGLSALVDSNATVTAPAADAALAGIITAQGMATVSNTLALGSVITQFGSTVGTLVGAGAGTAVKAAK